MTAPQTVNDNHRDGLGSGKTDKEKKELDEYYVGYYTWGAFRYVQGMERQ